MNKFEKMFFPDALKTPKALKGKAFRAARNFEPPKELILVGYCVPVDNQGQTPWCAAFSAANYAENILWRKRGYHSEIDPEPLYRYAKSVDGDPDGDGTYLEFTLQALVKYGHFDGNICKVRTFGGPRLGSGTALQDVKYAIHRYGVCMAGFDITAEWFSPRNGVVTGNGKGSEGGHAVLIVGYDEGGVIVQNSWGRDYAHDGFVYISNRAFADQFIYGAVLTRSLDGFN